MYPWPVLLGPASSGLPLSYHVDPPDFFDKFPDEWKPHATDGGNAPECDGKWATKEEWNAYNFQTEQMLVRYSCNIYDAAVGSMALAVTGHMDEAARFFWEVWLASVFSAPSLPPRQGCVRWERTSEAAPGAVWQAVGGGCRSGWGRLLLVTN